jgi:hypothetical protein
MEIWFGKLDEAEPYPDVAYWRSRTDEEIFDAAWQMVVEAHALKGEDLSESRLQRSVAALLRRDE